MNEYDPKTEIPLEGLEEFFDGFLLSRQEELGLMRDALVLLDFNTLSQIAHQWKGFSAPYGFGKLERLAIELEVCAHNAQAEHCESILLEADQYLNLKKSSSRKS